MEISPLIPNRKHKLYKLRLPNNNWVNLTYYQIKNWNKPYKDAYFSIGCYMKIKEYSKLYESVRVDEKLKDKYYMFQDIYVLDYDNESKLNILKGDKVMKSLGFKRRYILQTSPNNFQWCYSGKKVYFPEVRDYVKELVNTLKDKGVSFDEGTMLNIHNIFRIPYGERMIKK